MIQLLEQHKMTTSITADTVVDDSKYGTIDNFIACHDRGIQMHAPDLRKASVKRVKKLNKLNEDQFQYDQGKDVYRCPAGNELILKSLHKSRQGMDYAAPKKVCAACQSRKQCTRNKSGRTIKRNLRQSAFDTMREASRSPKAKRNIKTRQHLLERSFARSTRYDFDQARWLGLWRLRIQEYLICSVQHIEVLIKNFTKPEKSIAAIDMRVNTFIMKTVSRLVAAISSVFCGQLHYIYRKRYLYGQINLFLKMDLGNSPSINAPFLKDI